MQFYNMLTCDGFDLGFMGGCGMAWMGAVILFFIVALTRKWLGEEMDIPFSFIFSITLGLLAYFIVVGLTGSFKWGELAGIIAAGIGGFGMPYFTGEGGSD